MGCTLRIEPATGRPFIMSSRPVAVAALLLPVLGFADLSRADQPAAGAEVILNDGSYWRCAYIFGNEGVSPELLRKGPSEWISGEMLARTKKSVQRHAAHPIYRHRYRGFRPEQWHRHVFVATTSKSQYSHNHGLTREKLPPPEDWTRPDFDDLDWPRVRNPHLMGTPPLVQGHFTGTAQLDIGRACFRAFFELAHLDRGALILSLTYRGGVRVFLNGTEITRKHIPEGKLGPETTAKGYPPEAYVMLKGEGAVYRKFYRAKEDDKLFWADLYGPYKKPGPPRRYYQPIHPDSADIWARVQRSRDRKIEGFTLPVKLLRRGSNCLAIEVFRSDLHPVVLNRRGSWGKGHTETDVAWSHACLPRVELKAPKGAAVSSLSRPGGVRVWAEDIHAELYPFDFLEPGAPAGKVHALGPKNGVASALLVVGADRYINNVRVELSDLKHEKMAGRLEASRLSLFSLKRKFLAKSRINRCFNSSRGFVLYKRYPEDLPFLSRYGHQRGYEKYVAHKLSYLDQLQPGVINGIKKDTIQPYWISVQIPPDAKAGRYVGTVAVRAGGAKPTVLPLTVEVMDWAVPDPCRFQTFVGIEQSPYGAARQYGVRLWSDAHFRLIEASMKQLGRAGNVWLTIPCSRNTPFGNRDDQMIRWTRKKDGTLSFDFSILDRYLNLAQKHWKRLSVINFVVAPGNQLSVSFNVLDEAAGKVEAIQVHAPKQGIVEAHKAELAAFCRAVDQHMKARKLLQATYWGFTWDNTSNIAGLRKILAETSPKVFWCRAGHNFRFDQHYRVSTSQYGWSCDVDLLKYGWKNEKLALLGGSCRVNPISDNNPPHVYRTFADTGLNSGLRGIAQVGADYWGAFAEGFVLGPGRFPGFSCENILYPGEHGAESSVRYEAFLQGLQEAEARIFIEKAIDGNAIPDALKRELRESLIRYANEKAFSFGYHPYMRGNHGWRARARIIYGAAAKLARVLAAKKDG